MPYIVRRIYAVSIVLFQNRLLKNWIFMQILMYSHKIQWFHQFLPHVCYFFVSCRHLSINMNMFMLLLHLCGTQNCQTKGTKTLQHCCHFYQLFCECQQKLECHTNWNYASEAINKSYKYFHIYFKIYLFTFNTPNGSHTGH